MPDSMLPTASATPSAGNVPLLAIGFFMGIAIFAIDLYLPLGYAGGMAYVFPVLLGLWLGNTYTLTAVVSATLLTLAGYWLSPPGGVAWIVALNRIGAILMQWLIGAGVLTYLRMQAERKQLAQRVRVYERLAIVGEATTTFAHELANPLGGLLLHAQVIEHIAEQAQPDALTKLRASAAVVVSELERLRTMLHDFRTASIEPRFDFEWLRIRDVVQHVVELHALQFEAESVAVRRVGFDAGNIDDRILADRTKLTQVLMNLVKNAIEAMPHGGTLTLSLDHGPRGPLLRLSDTGTGTPEGIDILQPFTTTKPRGSGLGLAVVVQIMAGHGGGISYESHAGRGTTFTLSFGTPAAYPTTRPMPSRRPLRLRARHEAPKLAGEPSA